MTALPAPFAGTAQSPKVPVIIGAALFMELLDSTAVMTALRMNLVVSLYMLALALCLPVSGWAAERFRPRQVPPLDRRGLLLSGAALALLVFGFESLGLGELPRSMALGLVLGGLLCAAGYLLHAGVIRIR